MITPSASVLRTYSPFWRSCAGAVVSSGCPSQTSALQHTANFSTTQQRQKRKGGGEKKDVRISLIRYFLHHPITPRPLRLSRARFLRHWTIHRAWKLHEAKTRAKRSLELQQQYQSMSMACEALRNIDSQGLTVEERSKLGIQEAAGEAVGKLYRVAMIKSGIWDSIPIEYAKIQTDTPPRNGWNHEWTR